MTRVSMARLAGFIYLVLIVTGIFGLVYVPATLIDWSNPATTAAQIMYLLVSYNNATLISSVFWGAWLLPFGYLVFRSGILPKILGVCLMLGCVGYMAEFILKFVFSQEVVPFYVGLPGTIGEFGICLWMLVMGAKKEGLQSATAEH